MSCRRCPHHVRHGFIGSDKKTIQFADLCGLKIKQQQKDEMLEKFPVKKAGAEKKPAVAPKLPPRIYDESHSCDKIPFHNDFDYMRCNVYLDTFKTTDRKLDVLPTKDFQYSESILGGSITDMELL